jgi:hypothetical protein
MNLRVVRTPSRSRRLDWVVRRERLRGTRSHDCYMYVTTKSELIKDMPGIEGRRLTCHHSHLGPVTWHPGLDEVEIQEVARVHAMLTQKACMSAPPMHEQTVSPCSNRLI